MMHRVCFFIKISYIYLTMNFYRLSSNESNLIKKVILDLDPHAIIYLFGSRVDLEKRGGDIDLLVISNSLGQKSKSKIRIEIQKNLGDQKIDILLKLPDEINSDPFATMAFNTGVKL